MCSWGSSVISWNSCGEEHLTNPFRLNYGQDDSRCTLAKDKFVLKELILLNENIENIKRILTEINRAPIHILLGEGKGNIKRPTPYIATAKK